MKRILLYITIVLMAYSCQLSESDKIDYYLSDTTMLIWSAKFNRGIFDYTGSTDTIILGVDNFETWSIKINFFIDSVGNDSIIYGTDDFEAWRTKFNNSVDSSFYKIPNLYIGDSIFTGNNANMLPTNDWVNVGFTIDFTTYPGNMYMPFESGNEWASLSNQFGTKKDSRMYLRIKRIAGSTQTLHIGRKFASTVDVITDTEIVPDTTWGTYIWTIRGDLATDIFYIGVPSSDNKGSDFLVDYCYMFETDTIVEDTEQTVFATIPKVNNGGNMLDSIQANSDNLAIVGVVGNSIMANNYGGESTLEAFAEAPPRMTIRNIPRRIYDTLFNITTGFNKSLYRRIDHGDWSLSGVWTDTTGKDVLRPAYGSSANSFRTNYSYTATPNATAEIIIPDGYENFAIIYHKSKDYYGATYDDSVYVELNSGSISAYGDTIINTYRNTLVSYRDGLYQVEEYGGLPSGSNTITITKDNTSDNLVMWGVAYWTGKTIMVLNYAAGGQDMKSLWDNGISENTRLLENVSWRMFDYVFLEMTGMNESSKANTLEFQQAYTENILNVFKTIPLIAVTTHPFGCDPGCASNYYTIFDLPVDLERRYDRFYNYSYYDSLETYNIFRDFETNIVNDGGSLVGGEGGETYTSDGQHPNVLGTETFVDFLMENIFK